MNENTRLLFIWSSFFIGVSICFFAYMGIFVEIDWWGNSLYSTTSLKIAAGGCIFGMWIGYKLGRRIDNE